jgi:hypothetical protein
MRLTRRHVALLAAAVLVGLVLRLWFFTGLVGSDDCTHAYAAHNFVDLPTERHVPMSRHFHGSINTRRLGVNAPLYLADRLFGMNEVSYALVPLFFGLAGILIAFAATRRLGGALGTEAGLLAAWLWAVLPVDIYHSTIWMGDVPFAAVLAAMLGCMAASELGKHPRAWAFGAGLALGYLFFLKETSMALGAGVAVWLVIASVQARRLDRRILWSLGGFLLVHLITLPYFWWMDGDALYHYKSTFARYTELANDKAIPLLFPANWKRFLHYLIKDWVFGGVFFLLIPAMFVPLVTKRLPGKLRLGIAVIVALQLWVLGKALMYGSWTQRYTLQVSAPLIVLGAIGITMVVTMLARHRVVERVPAPWRPALVPALLAVIVLATALPLDHKHQQHTRARAQMFHEVYTYLDNNADANERIFTADGYTILYTRRVLAFLGGYNRWKGGWGSLPDAQKAQHGWVVLSSLENRYGKKPGLLALDEVPANWLEVYRAEHVKQWARVYKILPEPVPAGLAVVERNVQYDLSGLTFTAVAPDQIGPSERWNRGIEAPVLERQADGVRVAATAVVGAEKSLVGVAFPIKAGFGALKLDLHIEGDIDAVLIYTNGAPGKSGATRWRWTRKDKDPEHDVSEALVAGRGGVKFQPIDMTLPGDQARQVHVFVRLKPGQTGGLTVKNVQVAPATK